MHLVKECWCIPVVVIASKYQIHADLVVLQNEGTGAYRIVSPCLATGCDVVAIDHEGYRVCQFGYEVRLWTVYLHL